MVAVVLVAVLAGRCRCAQVVVVETKLLRHFCTDFVFNTAGTPGFVVGKGGVGGQTAYKYG